MTGLNGEDYFNGDMRGAHLKLAQRHKKLIPGQFGGTKRFEAEFPHPGVVTPVAISFTTGGLLPKESRIVCVLPDHGWEFPANPINAELHLPLGMPVSSIRTTWTASTHTLEFTLLNSEIPAGTDVIVLISGVMTPESARPTAEVVVTSYEKLVVRDTVPPSTRGGQIIDGPTSFTLPKIRPGELTGARKWQPFSCCPSAVSDVTLRLTVHGRIPKHGKLLIELPSDGWDMNDTPTVLLRTSDYHNTPLTASWRREQVTLEVPLQACSIPHASSITLTVLKVKNPAKETMNNSATAATSTIARVTTLTASGGVIDGPTQINVSQISELREVDFEIAKQAFDQVDVEKAGFISVEKLPDGLRRTGVVLAPGLYDTLVMANLPVPKPVDGEVATSHVTTITREEFLNVFALVYAPAFKYGQDLRLACGRGQVERVREWISRGCDPNAKDGSGWAALHYAADFGHLSSIDALVESLADVQRSTDGVRASVTLDVNLQDVGGWTPIMCAAANGHTHIVEKLLALGADLKRTSAEGRTALHWAATRGMDECVLTLLGAGADPNVADRSGWTPLHCAMLHGNASCTDLLVEKGADPHAKDLLHYAASHYTTSPHAPAPVSVS